MRLKILNVAQEFLQVDPFLTALVQVNLTHKALVPLSLTLDAVFIYDFWDVICWRFKDGPILLCTDALHVVFEVDVLTFHKT